MRNDEFEHQAEPQIELEELDEEALDAVIGANPLGKITSILP